MQVTRLVVIRYVKIDPGRLAITPLFLRNVFQVRFSLLVERLGTVLLNFQCTFIPVSLLWLFFILNEDGTGLWHSVVITQSKVTQYGHSVWLLSIVTQYGYSM